ncbi:MAG: hypothetical protein JNL01_12400 [Bdellovibrionales bacterium]|nr:hypothetical protein [Bdellovibrionales bacterium]
MNYPKSLRLFLVPTALFLTLGFTETFAQKATQGKNQPHSQQVTTETDLNAAFENCKKKTATSEQLVKASNLAESAYRKEKSAGLLIGWHMAILKAMMANNEAQSACLKTQIIAGDVYSKNLSISELFSKGCIGKGFNPHNAMRQGDKYLVARAIACEGENGKSLPTFQFQGHTYNTFTGRKIK